MRLPGWSGLEHLSFERMGELGLLILQKTDLGAPNSSPQCLQGSSRTQSQALVHGRGIRDKTRKLKQEIQTR